LQAVLVVVAKYDASQKEVVEHCKQFPAAVPSYVYVTAPSSDIAGCPLLQLLPVLPLEPSATNAFSQYSLLVTVMTKQLKM
jgi:hypothetical protein